MKQILLAFIISISLHLVAIYLFKDKKSMEELPASSKNKSHKQSNIKFVRLEQKPIIKKVEVKPIVKQVIKKQPVKKKIKKKAPKKLKTYTKVKKVVKKAKRKIIKKPLVKTYKKTTKELPKPNEIDYQTANMTQLQKDLLKEYLAQPLLRMDQLDKQTQESIKLYEEEYEGFTKVQKVFLQNNLRKFQVITQRVLNRMGYPKMAAKLNLSGTNVVEFMFHPDGSISDLRITNSSGYAIFDNYTLELIEIAYKDYPRPIESTKIKFYVRYIGR
jgi:protein TonB